MAFTLLALAKILFIITCFLAQGSRSASDAQITSVSTSSTTLNTKGAVPLQGGTTIYISGTGFGLLPSILSVYIRYKPCTILENQCVYGFVACVTPSFESSTPTGLTAVQMYQSGQQVSCSTNPINSCFVNLVKTTYNGISGIFPGATYLVSPTQAYLPFFVMGLTSSTGVSISLGDTACTQPSNVTTSNVGYNKIHTCSLYSTSITRYVATYNYITTSDPNSYFFETSGNGYQTIVLPSILSLSTNSGTKFGQVLTITGVGFSTTASENTVTVGGIACAVTSATSTTLTCDLAAGTPATLPLYEGSYGIIAEQYSTSGTYPDIRSSLGTPTSSIYLMTSENIPTDGVNGIEVIKGYFRAPVTGDYTFIISSNTRAYLYFSTTLNPSDAKLVATVQGSSWRSLFGDEKFYKFYQLYDPTSRPLTLQFAASVSLTAGMEYYFEAGRSKGTNFDDHLTLGAIVNQPIYSGQTSKAYDIYVLRVTKEYETWKLHISHSSCCGKITFEMRRWGNWQTATTAVDYNSDELTFSDVLEGLIPSRVSVKIDCFDASNNPITGRPRTGEPVKCDYYFKILDKDVSLQKMSAITTDSGIKNLTEYQTHDNYDIQTWNNPTITLSINGNSVEIPYTTSESSIVSRLLEVPGVYPPVDVTIWKPLELSDETHFVIRFAGNPGTGVGPVSITQWKLNGPAQSSKQANKPWAELFHVLSASSNSELLFPLPYEMLHMGYPQPQAVVTVNGMRAVCFKQNCNYEITTTGVPTVTDFNVDFYTGVVTLGINEHFPGDASLITITVEGEPCSSVTITSITEITCQLPLDTSSKPLIPGGKWVPYIMTPTGAADVSSVLGTPKTPLISDIVPPTGSVNGGTSITITGNHFINGVSSAVSVTIDGQSCTVTSATITSIVCITPPGSSGVLNQLIVTVNTVPSDPSASFSYIAQSLTVTLDPVPGASPGESVTLTLLASSGSFDGTCYPEIKDPNGNIITYTGLEFEASKLKCTITVAHPGTYSVNVNTSIGYATKGLVSSFEVDYKINSLSIPSGGQGGGYSITITGTNFGADLSSTVVYFGPTDCSTAGASTCEMTTMDASSIECEVPSSSTTGNVFVFLIKYGLYCSSSPNPAFEYSTALTPIVTSISSSEVAVGDTLTLTGTELLNPTSVMIGTYSATVTASDSTSVTITVPPSVPVSIYNISLDYDSNSGKAIFQGVSNQITVKFPHVTLSPKFGSKGYQVMKFSGQGFHSSMIVTAKKSSTSTNCVVLTALTTSTDLYCQMYFSDGEYQFTISALSSDMQIYTYTEPSLKYTVNYYNRGLNSVSPTSYTGSMSMTLNGWNFEENSNSCKVFLQAVDDPNTQYNYSCSVPAGHQATLTVASPPIGTWLVLLRCQDDHQYAYHNTPSPITITVGLTPSTFTSTTGTVTSSFAGGLKLTINSAAAVTGHWLQVRVCSYVATISNRDANSIDFYSPTIPTPSTNPTYHLMTPAFITPKSGLGNDGSNATNAWDNSESTSYSPGSSSTSCYVRFDFGDSHMTEVHMVKFLTVQGSSSTQNYNGLQFESSSDGSTFQTLYTISTNGAVRGWNHWYSTEGSRPSARYYRFYHPSNYQACQLAEVKFYGIDFHQDTTPLSCSVEVQILDSFYTVSGVTINYDTASTPKITSVSANYVSIQGGESLVINGIGFSSTQTDNKVFIDNMECTITSSTISNIICTVKPNTDSTQRSPPSQALFYVEVAGKGRAANQGNHVLYVQKWSDTANTWGGSAPTALTSVTIGSTTAILLDVANVQTKNIIIQGALIFSDMAITLQTGYIFIESGFLRIGTETQPIQNNIEIILDGRQFQGTISFGYPFYTRTIAIYEGTLDIHGKSVSKTWTTLAATADATTNQLILADTTDWQVGDKLVITPTSDSNQHEVVTVNAISGTTVDLSGALQYTHGVYPMTYGGKSTTIAAAVGRLTRNIVISSPSDGMGGPTIFGYNYYGADAYTARISNVQMKDAGRLWGFFPEAINFYRLDGTLDSYIKKVSIYNSHSTAIALYRVTGLPVQDNVIYRAEGFGIVAKYGNELYNSFLHNLIVSCTGNVPGTTTGYDGINVANGQNTIRWNYVSLAQGGGINLGLVGTISADSPVTTSNYCPTGNPIGVISDNVLSWSGTGLILGTVLPRERPCNSAYDINPTNTPTTFTLSNFSIWGNKVGFYASKLGPSTVTNFRLVDNTQRHFDYVFTHYGPPGSTTLSDALIVGYSSYIGSIGSYSSVIGIRTPLSYGINFQDIAFAEFPAGTKAAISTYSSAYQKEYYARSFNFSALTFSNVTAKRVKFESDSKSEILYDSDGTLTALTGGGWVVHGFEYIKNNTASCITNLTIVDGGFVCKKTVQVRRIQVIPKDSSLLGGKMKVAWLASTSPASSIALAKYELIDKVEDDLFVSGNVFVFSIVTGAVYHIKHQTGDVSSGLTFNRSQFAQSSDSKTVFAMNYDSTSVNHLFYLVTPGSTTGDLGSVRTSITTLGSHGDFYVDCAKQVLFGTIKGGPTTYTMSELFIGAVTSAFDCDGNCSSCFDTTHQSCTCCIKPQQTQLLGTCSCPSQQYWSPLNVTCTTCSRAGVYLDESTDCYDCNSSCLTCTTKNNCTSCKSGTYLHETYCLKACPTYYYSNSSTWKCDLMLSESDAETVATLSDTSTTSAKTASAAMAVSSLSGAGGANLLGAAFGAQMVQFCRYINATFPSQVLAFFNNSSPVSLQIPAVLNFMSSGYYEEDSELNLIQDNGNLELYETSQYLFDNVITNVNTLLLLLLLCFGIYALTKKRFKEKINGFFKKAELSAWNFFSVTVFSSTLEITFYSFLNLAYPTIYTPFGYLNFIFSIIFLIGIAIYMVWAIYILRKIYILKSKRKEVEALKKQNEDAKKESEDSKTPNENKDPDVTKEDVKKESSTPDEGEEEEIYPRMEILHDDYKDERLIHHLYIPISLARIILFSVTLVYLPCCPKTQGIIALVLHVAFFGYLTITRPLKKKFDLCVQIYFELCVVGVTICAIGIAAISTSDYFEDYMDAWNNFGWTIVYINFFLIAGSLVLSLISIVQLIVLIYRWIKKWRIRQREARLRRERERLERLKIEDLENSLDKSSRALLGAVGDFDLRLDDLQRKKRRRLKGKNQPDDQNDTNEDQEPPKIVKPIGDKEFDLHLDDKNRKKRRKLKGSKKYADEAPGDGENPIQPNDQLIVEDINEPVKQNSAEPINQPIEIQEPTKTVPLQLESRFIEKSSRPNSSSRKQQPSPQETIKPTQTEIPNNSQLRENNATVPLDKEKPLLLEQHNPILVEQQNFAIPELKDDALLEKLDSVPLEKRSLTKRLRPLKKFERPLSRNDRAIEPTKNNVTFSGSDDYLLPENNDGIAPQKNELVVQNIESADPKVESAQQNDLPSLEEKKGPFIEKNEVITPKGNDPISKEQMEPQFPQSKESLILESSPEIYSPGRKYSPFLDRSATGLQFNVVELSKDFVSQSQTPEETKVQEHAPLQQAEKKEQPLIQSNRGKTDVYTRKKRRVQKEEVEEETTPGLKVEEL